MPTLNWRCCHIVVVIVILLALLFAFGSSACSFCSAPSIVVADNDDLPTRGGFLLALQINSWRPELVLTLGVLQIRFKYSLATKPHVLGGPVTFLSIISLS